MFLFVRLHRIHSGDDSETTSYLYPGTANVRLLASCFIVHTCVDTNDSTQQLERAERLGQLNCTGML